MLRYTSKQAVLVYKCVYQIIYITVKVGLMIFISGTSYVDENGEVLGMRFLWTNQVHPTEDIQVTRGCRYKSVSSYSNKSIYNYV